MISHLSALNSPGFFMWIPGGDDAWKVFKGISILKPWVFDS
jgi:hypothetical protein